jgi:predicted permease
MLRNYFKTAFRSLVRNKAYSAINIAGLSVGIAVCTIIFAIIQFHLSFDNFHRNKDRIYRVLTEYHHADSKDIFYGKAVAEPLPAALKKNFPQLELVSGIYASSDDQVLIVNDNGQAEKKFKESSGVFALEPSFFKIFNFPWLAGSARVLEDPNAAVLTKATAIKYFGDWKTAIGKSIKLSNLFLLKVNGIIDDIPTNTDFQLKVVIPYALLEYAKSTNWSGTNSAHGCYLLLREGTPAEAFTKQLRVFTTKMLPPEDKNSHIIQSLSKVHFDTQAGGYSGKTIGYQRINILWLIAAFILLIACTNFINLSTAQAVNRSKEVGVRKVLGSSKWHLKKQFLLETFLIVAFSTVVAVLITSVALPSITQILDIRMSFDLFSNPFILLFLITIVIVVTALAGFYPSVILSRFNPISALKNSVTTKYPKGISLRRGLVVFQFIVAQALIIGTLVIIKQMNYFNNQPLGFEKEAIVNVPFPNDSLSNTKLDYLRNELRNIQGVQQVSFSTNTPAEDNNDNWTTFRFNREPKERQFYAIIKFTDHEYVPTYKLNLVAGRNLQPSDTASEYLINESTVKSLNITNANDVLNKEISIWDDRVKGRIVGIIKDYHNRSFRAEYAPMIMTSMKKRYFLAGIKLDPKNAMAAMPKIEQLWNKTFPDFVYEYRFLDDKIAGFYKQENQLSQLYKIFAAIAIFLSCLGLYGLASFMVVQRTKEVGIRKVLGATVANVVYLFSKEFIILILIAFAIAAPLAWYFMHQWLQDYVYRITIAWWIFAVGGLGAVTIALISVSLKAIKAAIANPIKSLRTE